MTDTSPSADLALFSAPLEVFRQWFEEAQKTNKMREPRAMTLATLSPTGDLHCRVVLLKEISKHGLIFYTNYTSEKGKDLESNPRCEVNFYWDLLQKQVRIQGVVSKTSRETSVAYWNSRPRESQLSQYISKQSQPCESRGVLESAVSSAEQEFAGRPIPCPEHWGGYQILPTRFEFWTGQPGRLHDRIQVNKTGSNWTSIRLYP